MHTPSSHIQAAAHRALAGVSALMTTAEPLRPDDHLVLVGPEAALDSMAFVNFIVLCEDELERELGHRVSVTDILTAGDADVSPLTLGQVIAMLSARLERA